LQNGLDLNKIPSPDQFVTLTKEEQEAILELDAIKKFVKGSVLINEGQYFSESYHVVSGIVREYRLINGEEKTFNFYTDDEGIHFPTSSLERMKSTFTLECLEDCRISVVGFDKVQEMYKRFPRFEKMCRINTEHQLQELQERAARYMASSPEERYRNLLTDRPDLLDRVPQYHLASYLGIKPESLSRIRKRISQSKA